MFAAARRFPTLATSSARTFSTSAPRASDVAKVTLVGRLGADPELKQTSSGKPYYTYKVVTRSGRKNENGLQSSSWHTVHCFREIEYEFLRKIGKGSTVYVEANLEMRQTAVDPEAVGPRPLPRVFLRQSTINTINYIKPEMNDNSSADVEPEQDK
ncbi:hypothetical protein IAT38_007688 [Cryptococcus sp. DSM 104549]